MAAPLILLAVLLLTVAGCGEKDEPATGGMPGVRISVQLFGDGEEVKAFQAVADAYERASGAEVSLVAVGDRKDHLAKLTASFAARKPPDAFLINYRNVGGFVGRGVVDPVDQRLGAARSDYYEVALDAFSDGGELQCMPQNVSSLVVYYNRDLFERAGVPLPKDDWRFTDFFAAARRLTRAGRHGAGVDPGTVRAAPFVWGAGGELVDDTDRPTRFTLDTPAARAGLRTFVSLRAAGVSPDAKEAESAGLDERFIAGELAMLMSSRREVPAFRTISKFDWDVAPFPVLKRPVTVLHSDAWCLSRGGRAEDAWQFVEFATGPEGQAILARSGRTVPSLKSVATGPDFLDAGAPPKSSQVFLDQIEVMRRLPKSRNWARIEETADLALEQAYYGRLTIDEAIARIESETKGAF